MKLKTLFAIILALAVSGWGNITGTLDFSGAGLLKSGNVKVGFQGTEYPVAANGSYSIVTNTTNIKDNMGMPEKLLLSSYDVLGHKVIQSSNLSWATKLTSIKQYARMPIVAARTMAINDTLFIVVNGDTLREVPVNSWDTILPPNYIIQRNVGVTVLKANSNNQVQVVWWNTDSIAHVLELGRASTDSTKFSGYIYAIYDDVSFRTNGHLYSLFVRTRHNDSIKSYTAILDVLARVGDLTFSSTDFKENTKYIVSGYSLTPNDSSVAVYNANMNIKMEYFTDVRDSITILDSSSLPDFKRDTSYIASVCRKIEGSTAIECDSNHIGSIYIEVGRLMNINAPIGDTQTTLKLASYVFTGIATQNSERITLLHYDPSKRYILDSTITNVKIGDIITLHFSNALSYTSFKVTNGWLKDVKVTEYWRYYRSYWK